jgi:hypothetical protein
MLSKLPSIRSIKKLDVLLPVLGILGLVLFLVFYDRAFPSAALDLALSREQAVMLSRGWLE